MKRYLRPLAFTALLILAVLFGLMLGKGGGLAGLWADIKSLFGRESYQLDPNDPVLKAGLPQPDLAAGLLMKKNKIDVIMGTAKVKAGKKVEVKGADGKVTVYDGKHIIIATGARSRQLPNLPQDGKKIIGYREAMSLPKQPKSLVVVGSGAIGVEFAYFYATMGTKVTIVEFMPNIVPVEDEEVSKQLEKSIKKVGIEIMTEASVESVDTKGTDCKVHVKTEAGNVVLDAEIVLSAVGIAANIEGIGLEETGIKTDKGKILTDKYYATNVPGYYAIGDCIGGQASFVALKMVECSSFGSSE